ncbi:hypothetical protein Taro_012029 [Colocasia esculenta]|uniref:Uncharacterized protein n=1 Tax=Colocasia esculenta TaxID=4460 RepID=A0A843U7Z1_COLES|nr:hypothetical protein [Colocasia esculenta]
MARCIATSEEAWARSGATLSRRGCALAHRDGVAAALGVATILVLPRVLPWARLCVGMGPRVGLALRTFCQQFGTVPVVLAPPFARCLALEGLSRSEVVSIAWDPHPREPFEGLLWATSVLELAVDWANSGAEGKMREVRREAAAWPSCGVMCVVCFCGGSVSLFRGGRACTAVIAWPYLVSLGIVGLALCKPVLLVVSASVFSRFRGPILGCQSVVASACVVSRPCGMSMVRGGSACGPSTLWRCAEGCFRFVPDSVGFCGSRGSFLLSEFLLLWPGRDCLPGARHLRACPVQRLFTISWDPQSPCPLREFSRRRASSSYRLWQEPVAGEQRSGRCVLLLAAGGGGLVAVVVTMHPIAGGSTCEPSTLWRSVAAVFVAAEGCFRMVSDSAGSAGVVSLFPILWTGYPYWALFARLTPLLSLGRDSLSQEFIAGWLRSSDPWVATRSLGSLAEIREVRSLHWT